MNTKYQNCQDSKDIHKKEKVKNLNETGWNDTVNLECKTSPLYGTFVLGTSHRVIVYKE